MENQTKQVAHPTTCLQIPLALSEVIDLSSRTLSNQTFTETTMAIEKTSTMNRKLPILALFPTNTNHGDEHYPLFANIPENQLTEMEKECRRSGKFPSPLGIIDVNPMTPSFLREKYNLLFGQLMERFKIDLSILDSNYIRLNDYIKLFIAEQIRIFHYRTNDIKFIDDKEYPLLLEFYLQFDSHLFYMKTCSFRFARPRSIYEGLFCFNQPEARYDLSPCGNCSLCFPKYDRTFRLQPVIQFNQTHQYTFVNGYQSILNCSATCQTMNIIYVLACPCNHYDYIGQTSQSLIHRLHHHREYSHWMMREFLLGEKNCYLSSTTKSIEMQKKDRMLLYQHSIQCPVAMQIFLDYNPQYWPFVPMSNEEAEDEQEKYVQQPTLIDNPLNPNIRSKQQCLECVRNVPKPSNGYTFSNRQLMLQTQYFYQRHDHELFNVEIDLYNASIVTVLPETCSDIFRLLIESLFITHADTKLNKIGNMLKYIQLDDLQINNYLRSNRGHGWHQGLIRRPKLY